MPFIRRKPLLNKWIEEKFKEQQDAIDRLKETIETIQQNTVVKRTYSSIVGLTNWTTINEYTDGLVDCCGYMSNPFWTQHSDRVLNALAIVRLPVTFIDTNYAIITGSQTDTTKRGLGTPNCDYGNVHETPAYKKTTSSFPINICPHYTVFYFRVIGRTK